MRSIHDIVVAYPGNGLFAQQVALSLHEADRLHRFVTTLAVNPDANYIHWLVRFGGSRFSHLLRRRTVGLLPRDKTVTRPWLELVRSAAAALGASAPVVDRAWDWMSLDFTGYVARHWVSGSSAIYAYEYTALEAFERAKKEQLACVLDLPSLSSQEFEQIQEQERALFPEIQSKHDHYFKAKFEKRQARRDREIVLADVIMTNSTLTARSHCAQGTDPAKIVTVPLAAPRTISTIRPQQDMTFPLKVIWAGTFGIRKGAHYFIDAWKMLAASSHIKVNVYGTVTLPERLLTRAPDNIQFHGAVAQAELFRQFEQADVLLFPTLSDGFGMVVNEAFAQGLPVITTEWAGAADLVRHGENGLIIESGKAEAIHDALQWCLDNREQLQAMRYPALETAKNWQWEDYRAVFIDKLEQALEQAGFTFTKGEAV